MTATAEIGTAEQNGQATPDRFVSRSQAARFLGLSASTLASWASRGHGPKFIKMSSGKSGCVRYSLIELQKFADDPQGYCDRPVGEFYKAEEKTDPAPTARQREIHAWVTKFMAENGYSPSFRDIGKAFGIKSVNGVVCHLKPMRERGMVTWVDGVGRSLRALECDA